MYSLLLQADPAAAEPSMLGAYVKVILLLAGMLLLAWAGLRVLARRNGIAFGRSRSASGCPVTGAAVSGGPKRSSSAIRAY